VARRGAAALGTVAVAAAVAAIAFVAVPGARSSASAELLRAVDELARSTDAALEDGRVSAAEVALLRERAGIARERLDDTHAVAGLGERRRVHVRTVVEDAHDRLLRHEGVGADAELRELLDALRASASGLASAPGAAPPVGQPASATARGAAAARAAATAAASETRAAGSEPRAGTTAAPTPADTPSQVGSVATATPTRTAPASATPPASATAGAATPAAMATAGATATATASATATLVPPASSVSYVPLVAGTETTQLGDAGSVRWAIEAGGLLRVLGVSAAAGWSSTIEEADGSELRVRLTSGVRAVRFEAERQDSRVQIEITTAP
jgi:hypothetical protein